MCTVGLPQGFGIPYTKAQQQQTREQEDQLTNAGFTSPS
jgi:hypothetical protein